MKTFLLAIACVLMLVPSSFAQSVPLGMKYQAVARDSKGQIIANQKISLKITLLSDGNNTTYYTEVHDITTNELGLFTLVVGEGKVDKGVFKDVPWSTQDIWMQVSIKDNVNASFTVVSNSKLLAVPYAFHAATASQLVGGLSPNEIVGGTAATNGVPANVWSQFGNSNSDATTDKIGTTDFVDFVFVTNNIERLRILANGDIILKRSLSVGANLNVDSSVTLNTKLGTTLNKGPFTVGTPTLASPTFLYGPLTVYQNQPTLLGGTLTVDKATQLNSSLTVAGITNLNSNLFVNNQSPTKLTGTLNVDGITDLNNNLNVNNNKPTVLTGTVQVNGDATLNNHLNVTSTYQSTSTTTGAAVIAGGLGLGKNLNVGGDANFGGHTTFAGAVAITDLTESIDPTTGALTVGGGVGIGKRLNVAGRTQLNSKLKVIDSTTLSSTLDVAGVSKLASTLEVAGATTLRDTLGVTGATTLKSSLRVEGIETIKNTTGSTNTTSGALQVAGGLGVGENANIGGSLTTNGKLVVNAASDYVAEFNNSTDANGIAIKINTAQSNNNNHFVTFKNGANEVVGRIQGETLDELHNDLDYQLDLTGKIYDVTSGAIDVSLATVNLAETIDFQISADASVNACAGLGIVACPPIASFVAGSIAEVVIATIEEALVVSEVVVASTDLGLWKANKEGSIGVTYQSGSGDYAEYLMKQRLDEKIFPGDIVGVKGGKISKDIMGAEKVMVVSHKPIVLGNTPTELMEKNYEKVAFMGQVPVRVFGKVNLGDYIIPNGLNNGVGVAVAPDKIAAKDVKNIVGIAWSTADNAVGLNNINVAIGLNVNDNQKLIEQQQNEIDDLKNQIAQTNAQLAKLIPGFKVANATATMAAATTTSNPTTPIAAPIALRSRNRNTARIINDGNTLPANIANTGNAANTTTAVPATLDYPLMGANQVEYVQISKTDFLNGFEVAEEKLNASGKADKFAAFWKKFKSDPSYKDEVVNKLMQQYQVQLQHHKALDASLNH
jgi:hypothetical protein